MAGSFSHMTKDDGTPFNDTFGVPRMLEDEGDCAEALEECYGMIWYLATLMAHLRAEAPDSPERQIIMAIIHEAVMHNREGAERGRSGS
jgi:hypothetical protein